MDRFLDQAALNDYHRYESLKENMVQLFSLLDSSQSIKLPVQLFDILNGAKSSFNRLNEEREHNYLEYIKRLKYERDKPYDTGEEKRKENIRLNFESMSSIERDYYNELYQEIEIQLRNQKQKNINRIKLLVEKLSKELVIGFDLNPTASIKSQLNYIQLQIQFQLNFQQHQYQIHSQKQLLKEYQDKLWIENQLEIEMEKERNSFIIDRSLTIKRMIDILVQRFI